ncbi:MAG TPA: ABC-type transport auxiliary lipoprotein family protein [Stellaceae bacterium]|nr:ABC-type transport auxiliary lipoprotein family protein [Stellaceae bacterium]
MPTRRLVLTGAALLAACRSPSPRLYTLVARPGIVIDRRLPLVAVRSVEIAKYLDRPQIVRHKTEFEFTTSDYDEWAAGLDDMATLILINDLALRLPRTQFAHADSVLDPASSTLVAVEIDRCDAAPDGTAILEARWDIRRNDQAGAVMNDRITVPAAPDDYAALASALSDCLGQLADRIARALSAG